MLCAVKIWSRISTPVSSTVVLSTLVPIRGTFTQNRRILKELCFANYGCGRLHARLPKRGVMDVCAKTFVGNRFYSKTHHDMPFPHKSFTEERRDSTKSLTKPTNDSETGRKLFTYLVVTAALIPANYGTKATVLQYVYNMTASADVLAMARIEVSLSDIPEGSNVTVKWRNKPLLIRHRTARQIACVQAVNLSDMRDQEPDNKRVQRPEWLVVVGICPHLGCAPIPNAGEYDGGYYCPCHGSHFDASGRIRKGPAPTNMEVPEYFFSSDTTIVVG